MNKINFKNISRFLYPVFCILISVLIFTGCATTTDVNKTQYDINLLNTEIREIKEKLSSQSQKEKFEALDRQQQEFQTTQEATARSVSDLLIQFQSLTAEFHVLTGRFEELRYNADKNSSEIKEERERFAGKLKGMELAIDDLNRKISSVEQTVLSVRKEETKAVEGDKKAEEMKTAGADPSDAGAMKPQAPEKKEPEKTEAQKEVANLNVKDLYLTGYQAFKEGKNTEARAKLLSLLKDYPENEYSDNARFWIAESYYKDENFEDAILAYEELLKKNPRSDKAAGAMWKQGLSFYALKDEKTGKLIFEKLIEQFPNSEQAQLAKKKIAKKPPSKKK